MFKAKERQLTKLLNPSKLVRFTATPNSYSLRAV